MKPVKVTFACDAGSYGLGSVLSHEFENGDERPISYASRTMNKSARNYAQFEREAFSLIFVWPNIYLVTDHKPLLSILGPKPGVPTMAAARMQR